jgi:integrase
MSTSALCSDLPRLGLVVARVDVGERLPVGVPDDVLPGIGAAPQGDGKWRDVIEGGTERSGRH